MILSSDYKLRGFNPTSPEQIERMNLMHYHPEVMKAMSYENTAEYINIQLGDLQRFDPGMFATKSAVTRKVDDVAYGVFDKGNQLIGWIWFTVDNRHPFPKLVARRYGLDMQKTRSYQIVYEKLLSHNWPEELVSKMVHTKLGDLQLPRKGVIVDGLRLGINKLKREYRKLYVNKRNIALYAYVLPDNISSKIVLERNGFLKEDKIFRYDGIAHDLWVKII